MAAERDEDARQLWRDDIQELDLARAIFLDECGTHLALTPLYARAPRGKRAVGRVPRNRGRATSLLASLTLAGIGPCLTIEGGVDAAVFAAYAEELLAPTLAAGDVVVMDNLAAHLDRRARAAIEARGAHILLLPPYSPDLMPIELAFGTLKAALRRAGARTREALEEAIAQALRAVTPAEARAWIAHCGYPLPAQPLRPP